MEENRQIKKMGQSWAELLDVTKQTIMVREAQEHIKDYTPAWASVSVKDL